MREQNTVHLGEEWGGMGWGEMRVNKYSVHVLLRDLGGCDMSLCCVSRPEGWSEMRVKKFL